MARRDWLQELLNEAGMTHQQLADRLGIKRPAVTQWISGTASPGRDHLLELAGIFGVEVLAHMGAERKKRKSDASAALRRAG